MKEYNIILGCLSDDDIYCISDENVIIVEPYIENYKRITRFKKYNYYIYDCTGKIELYYATNIPSDLRWLSVDKADIINDITDHCELSRAKKMLAIASITSCSYNTITLYDLFNKNGIKFDDQVNVYVSIDVDISKSLKDDRLGNFNISVYYNDRGTLI